MLLSETITLKFIKFINYSINLTLEVSLLVDAIDDQDKYLSGINKNAPVLKI